MKHLVLVAGLVSAGVALAEEGARPRVDLPLWELGAVAGAVSQQAYPGSEQQARRALALPYLIYRGKVLRADADGAGLRAVRTERFELDVSFAGSLSSGSETLRAREGMPRLNTLVEAGPVARWFVNGRDAGDRITFELPLRGVFEARNPSRHRGMSFEPRLSWQYRPRAGGNWGYGLSVGALFGDSRLGSAFYGVAASEARPDRPAYDARAGLIAWRVGASASTRVTPDLRLYVFGRLESLAGAANRDSALVRQTTGASYGIGLSYTLTRSAARASD
ncbi:MipA/OmpV family protein [Roseateles asaccharophilus]|uniref:Outer membrane scaffolding protein for murein synthesis (MipA/OmpV family) n=1 Tax=Roseateles asaccharophilus TaxID=582607 RepID=A0ABU2A138_9BURK|nr:MipA/OmpV family protein [Roseateles asaccharophilus]MDR7330899.1 outer membrane scaffolding protein for murein synthesis (MipA/OmpV family) [Roseateles asaccharophilus]